MTSLRALLRLAVLQRLGVLFCALAVLLAATNTASALEPLQTKTRVWGFDFAADNSSGLFRAASSGKHQGNRLARAEQASGSLLAAGAGASALSTAQKGALLRAGTQPFKDTALTQAGRALTKHPELVGLTKESLNQSLRSPAAINAAAEGALGGILQSGTAVSRTAGRFGQVLDVTGGSGFGARFSSAGEFIGFLSP